MCYPAGESKRSLGNIFKVYQACKTNWIYVKKCYILKDILLICCPGYLNVAKKMCNIFVERTLKRLKKYIYFV